MLETTIQPTDLRPVCGFIENELEELWSALHETICLKGGAQEVQRILDALDRQNPFRAALQIATDEYSRALAESQQSLIVAHAAARAIAALTRKPEHGKGTGDGPSATKSEAPNARPAKQRPCVSRETADEVICDLSYVLDSARQSLDDIEAKLFARTDA